MNEKILEILEKLKVPVVYGWYDENLENTHISFFQFDELPAEYSDDESKVLEHYFQIDIWSKSNVEKLKKDVRKVMEQAEFRYIDGRDQFETDTKIFHKAMRFYIAEIED